MLSTKTTAWHSINISCYHYSQSDDQQKENTAIASLTQFIFPLWSTGRIKETKGMCQGDFNE